MISAGTFARDEAFATPTEDAATLALRTQQVIAHETGHITGGHLARRAIAMRSLSGPAQIGLLIAAAAAAASGSAEALAEAVVVDTPDMAVFFNVTVAGDGFNGQFDAGGMMGSITGEKR